jgi:hypothetical protein
LNDSYFKVASSSFLPTSLRFGILEYLGDQPEYLTELYAMYKYSRIVSVTIRVEVANTGSNPILVALGSMPYGDSTQNDDPRIIAERPGAVSKIASGFAGNSTAVVQRTFTGAHAMGIPIHDKQYWITSGQAASTTPVDQLAPCIVVSVGTIDTSVGDLSYAMNAKVTYNVQFFDRKTKASI